MTSFGGVGGGTNPAGEVVDWRAAWEAVRGREDNLVEEQRHLRAVVEGLRTQLAAVSKDYRTLWGMTLGHDGQPPTDGTPDDVQRLRERAAALESGL